MTWLTALWPVYRTAGQLTLDLATAGTILGFCWYTWSGRWEADARPGPSRRKDVPR